MGGQKAGRLRLRRTTAVCAVEAGKRVGGGGVAVRVARQQRARDRVEVLHAARKGQGRDDRGVTADKTSQRQFKTGFHGTGRQGGVGRQSCHDVAHQRCARLSFFCLRGGGANRVGDDSDLIAVIQKGGWIPKLFVRKGRCDACCRRERRDIRSEAREGVIDDGSRITEGGRWLRGAGCIPSGGV